MNKDLIIYNTLSRKKEKFEPIKPPFVGLYVCGPTVYGDAHLGHARPAITFDIVFRFLKHLGYKVRYVRNITDVGHLENDADAGEDKIAKKARLEELEPMEIVQYYSERYHEDMRDLNVESPSIEPRASGHIIEQIEMVKEIVEAGYAYESNGSVYFDVRKYNEDYHYGKLSGRNIDDLIENTRELAAQEEKNEAIDFAIWKKAAPEHIMRWKSPWSDGFPGWHMECSAMSSKYLGDEFDIHGGGMDLKFPHHESEIAQSVASKGKDPVKYWMHNNMITINGQKMGKSLGNFITLKDFFKGESKLLSKAFSPMTIRFFILQAHYRSTLDFSNEALEAAEKGYKKLITAINTLDEIQASENNSVDISNLENAFYKALLDDFNTPILIAKLFDTVKIVNSIKDGKESINQANLYRLKQLMNTFVFEILGLKNEQSASNNKTIDSVMNLVLDIRENARKNKDWTTADLIRDGLSKSGIIVKDSKDGSSWSIK